MTKAQSIGALLRAAREKKNLTIERVHQDTKMMPRIISAMEEDAFDRIGAKTYQESFLKKYARYLGVDMPEEMMYAVKTQAVGSSQAAGAIFDKRQVPVKEEAPPRWIILAAIMAMSLAAVITLGFVLAKSVKLSPPAKEARSEAKRKPQAAATPNMKIVTLAQKGEALRLKLYAKEDVWIKVRSDGKVLSQGILPKGSKEILEAKGRFNIWTGKVEALAFTVNDNPLDIKGKGVIKDIRITHDGIEMRR